MTSEDIRIGRRPAVISGLSAATALALGLPGQIAAQAAAPDMILFNGRVTTMDPQRPDATAFALRGGVFTAVGTDADILRLAGPDTRRVDAGGRRVIPGLNDTHTHTVRGGLNYALELRWDGIPTFAEAMARLREMVARTPQGQWVRVVGGYSPWQFGDERRHPTLDELNAIAPDTPVFVLNLYVGAFLNRAALRALSITRDTPDNAWPEGTIERGPDRQPTGLLLGSPSALILYDTLSKGPRLDDADALISTRHFMRELNRLGITSSLDCGGGYQTWPDDYGVIERLRAAGEMTVRLGVSTFIQRPGRELEDFRGWTDRYRPREGDDWLRLIGGGEMLVRSIYDFEIFANPRVVPPARAEGDLEPVVRLLVQKGWSFRFHATYDETVGRHLDVLERVHRDTPIDRLHWIVDHGETLSQRNMERIARMGGGIAIQNRIAFQEREFLARYGAEQAAQAPPIRRMLEMGIPVGAGTDMSRVSSYNPWLCLEWLVTGRGLGGAQLLSARTALDRMTALRLWTDNAWFSAEQDRKGRIAPGLLADFAVLDRD
ncbi:amidohydrolase [Leptolyngbya sp. 15MV]|nr:amidohydrolase [Leptolyngbya sp. 15MV]